MCRGLLAALVIISAYAQTSVETEFSRAMKLAAAGRFAEAEMLLRGIAKTHPKVFAVRYRLGLILLRQGRADDAAEELQAAVATEPSSSLAWASLAQARLKLNQRTTALEAAARAARLGVKDPPVWRALAIFYADAGDFARAASFEERWAENNPGDSEARTRAAELYVRGGKAERLAKQPARAAESFQNAFRVDPGFRPAYFELATMLLDHRTPKPAIAVLEGAAARFGKEPELHRLLGLAQYQTGNIPQAIESFCRAVDLAPDSEAGYASFESLLGDAGDLLPQITGRLRSFRERKPSSPVGHYLLARALTISDQPVKEVEALLRAAVQADPTFWPAHYELGQVLEKQGDAGDALQSFLMAEKLNPAYAPTQFSLARLYASRGDRAKSIEHRRKHGELQARQREEAARTRAAAPTLNYRLEPPPNGR